MRDDGALEAHRARIGGVQRVLGEVLRDVVGLPGEEDLEGEREDLEGEGEEEEEEESSELEYVEPGDGSGYRDGREEEGEEQGVYSPSLSAIDTKSGPAEPVPGQVPGQGQVVGGLDLRTLWREKWVLAFEHIRGKHSLALIKQELLDISDLVKLDH